MSKRLLYAALTLALSIGLSATGAMAEKQRLLLGTSTVGGSYYMLGGTWAKIINDKLPEYDISVEVGAGPVATIPLVQNKEMDMAYVTAWTSGEMFYGKLDKNPKEYNAQRAFLPLYASYVYLYTLKDSGIKSIHDYAGKPVSTGSAGSSSFLAGRVINKALGLNSKLSGMPTGQQLNTLRDGQTKAAYAVSGVPAPFLMELEATHEVEMISLSDADLDMLLKAQPFWSRGVIPAGTYKCNKDKDISAISLWNFAVANKDLPEDMIYKITKASFESLPQLAAAVKTMGDLKPQDILNSSIPLHPGAVRYYREKGVDIPDKLLPPEMK